MKKKSLLKYVAVLLLFVVSLSSCFAFGLDEIVNRGPREAIDLIVTSTTPFFEVLIGDYAGGSYFFAKVWLLVLLFIVINSIVKKIPAFDENNWVVFIISLVVSIFAIRYLPENLIELVLVPYTVLGITLISILPFLIFFWFIHHAGMVGPGRRLAWGLYGALFALLTYSKYPDMVPLAKKFYLIIIGLVVLAFAFDRKIHTYFRFWEIKKAEKSINDKIVISLLNDLEEAEKQGHTDQGKEQVKRIRKRLRELGIRNL